jgi:hypothetical protein
MTADYAPVQLADRSALKAIAAAGLIGPRAFQGGAAAYVLGVFLHFFIAVSAAPFYYMASRRMSFLAGARTGLRLAHQGPVPTS